MYVVVKLKVYINMRVIALQFFLNDSFGLQTLYNRKRIQTYSIPGVQHIHWHTNKTVFDCCIEPYLD